MHALVFSLQLYSKERTIWNYQWDGIFIWYRTGFVVVHGKTLHVAHSIAANVFLHTLLRSISSWKSEYNSNVPLWGLVSSVPASLSPDAESDPPNGLGCNHLACRHQSSCGLQCQNENCQHCQPLPRKMECQWTQRVLLSHCVWCWSPDWPNHRVWLSYICRWGWMMQCYQWNCHSNQAM